MSEKPVVIVTGASRGLGAAVARWLAKSGAAITLVARSEEKLLQIAYYRQLKERGELEPPEVPARSIA
jgi:short-subunit dehydrogenase